MPHPRRNRDRKRRADRRRIRRKVRQNVRVASVARMETLSSPPILFSSRSGGEYHRCGRRGRFNQSKTGGGFCSFRLRCGSHVDWQWHRSRVHHYPHRRKMRRNRNCRVR
jgi:hypothetical protein